MAGRCDRLCPGQHGAQTETRSAVYHMPVISMLPSAHSIVIPGSGGKVACIVEAEHYVRFEQERKYHQIRSNTELHFRAI